MTRRFGCDLFFFLVEGLGFVLVVKVLEGVAMDGWAAPAAFGGHRDGAEMMVAGSDRASEGAHRELEEVLGDCTRRASFLASATCCAPACWTSTCTS